MKVLALLVVLLAPSLAQAVLSNGNFESGLASWTTTGDVLTVDSSFGVDPPQGHLQVLMTTAPCYPFCGGAEHPTAYSGTNSSGDIWLGFFNASLPILFEGSGIKQTFVAETDLLVSFTWKFLTDPGGGADYRFYVLDGIAHTLTPSGGFLSPSPFNFESSYETISFFLPAGVHTLGFGIGDVGDTGSNAGLLMDDISFRAVPEPPAWLLGVLCLLMLAYVQLSRRHPATPEGKIKSVHPRGLSRLLLLFDLK